MKKRLKTFESFKNSYLNESEDTLPQELNEVGNEEVPAVEDMTSGEDLSVDGGEFSEYETADEETSEEDEAINVLKDKIKSIIDSNYSETFTDFIKGITNELEDNDDQASFIDALLDVLEEKTEEVLAGNESDLEDMPLDGEDMNDESGEELPMEDEISDEESGDAPVAPEMTEEEEILLPPTE